MDFKKILIICGHYGSGKTTVSLNLALRLANGGKSVTLVDMDVINPYFRSSDYRERLAGENIRLIAPTLAGTTLDVPALSPQISSVFSGNADHVIFDTGGDDAGISALGRYHEEFSANDYEMMCVINRYRKITEKPEDAVTLMRDIEKSSRLTVTSLIHNSHLSSLTTPDDIFRAVPYAEQVAALTGLPVRFTAVPDFLVSPISQADFSGLGSLFPLKLMVQPPWNQIH